MIIFYLCLKFAESIIQLKISPLHKFYNFMWKGLSFVLFFCVWT